uniref:Uncharacterized protein n=1 Tax=Brassica oleracea TaxID=3712 RepID=A0A3P6G7J4_BRAOL|nr:unnamed protein product [Brassica oleracea]
MFVLQQCLGVSFSACRVGGLGSPVPNGIGGCGLLRLLLFSNNPSAWVRHLRAVNGSGLVCGVSVRLRVLSVVRICFLRRVVRLPTCHLYMSLRLDGCIRSQWIAMEAVIFGARY